MAEAYGIRPARRSAALESLQWPVIAAVAAIATAGLTVWSIQGALTVIFVFGIVALYVSDRTLGATTMVVLWFVAPGIRRLVQYKTGYINADPLSLAPFLSTGVIVALEIGRSRLPQRPTRLLLCAAGGFAIGLAVGLATVPLAAIYAVFGYLSAIGAAVIGFNEAREDRPWSLGPAIRVALPLIAVYAVIQGVVTMPAWDQKWLDTVQITSIGVPGHEGAIRAFGTLNAPGVLAGLLAVGLMWYLTLRRPGSGGAIAAACFVAALALTYVRGAWVGLLIAALGHVILTRGRTARRVGAAVLVTVVAVGAMAGSNPAAGSLVSRISSFGSLGQDTSAQARVATPTELVSTAVVAPAGHGLGTVGEASRLAPQRSQLRYPDNAYLSLLFQSGPIGFLLVIGAVAAVFRAAWRLARRASPVQAQAETCVAILLFILVFMVSGDHFYGAVGVVFWLVAGYVLGLEHRATTSSRITSSPAQRTVERPA